MDIKTVRREVTTMANRINRKFHNLSMSFRKAWAIVKCKMLVCKVTGTSFKNRQEALRRIEKYAKTGANIQVAFDREVNNLNDTNPIKVNVSVNGSKEYHLGYLPKGVADYIAPIFDKINSLKGQFIEVVVGCWGKPIRGCKVGMIL